MTDVAPHLTAGFWCRSPGSPSYGSLVLCASSSARSTIGCFARFSWAAGCSFWPCCLRGSDLGKSDSDARWSECQRRRLRVRPPPRELRLRHANGGGVHAIGQDRRAPDLGPAALGLIPGIPDGSGSSGGSRRAALDTTRVSKLGFAGQPGDSLRPAAQPWQHSRGRS
jgi:hypothetical protein